MRGGGGGERWKEERSEGGEVERGGVTHTHTLNLATYPSLEVMAAPSNDQGSSLLNSHATL